MSECTQRDSRCWLACPSFDLLLCRSYIATSVIPDIGRGIFAKYDFEPGDLIVEFLGKRYNDWTQTYDNCKYAVEIKTKEDTLAYIDGWGIGACTSRCSCAPCCNVTRGSCYLRRRRGQNRQ